MGRKLRTERGRPGYPRVMKQNEIASVMGNENAPLQRCVEQLSIVRCAGKTEFACREDLMAG